MMFPFKIALGCMYPISRHHQFEPKKLGTRPYPLGVVARLEAPEAPAEPPGSSCGMGPLHRYLRGVVSVMDKALQNPRPSYYIMTGVDMCIFRTCSSRIPQIDALAAVRRPSIHRTSEASRKGYHRQIENCSAANLRAIPWVKMGTAHGCGESQES